MKLLQQKRDLSSTTYYILLCFVLLCVFVIVPIILLIYSYHLGSSDLSAASSVLFRYCLAVVIVAVLFLVFVYKKINKTAKEDFKTSIINDVHNELYTQIDNYIESKALNNMLKDAISDFLGGFNCCAKIYDNQGVVTIEIKDKSDKILSFSLNTQDKSYTISSKDGDYTFDNGFTITIYKNQIKKNNKS